MRSTRPGRGIATAALLSALAVGGCAAQPGSAAVVNGEHISESFLAQAVTDFADVTGQPVEAPQMLGTLIVVPVILDVAAEHDIGASEDEAAALLDQQAEMAGLDVPEGDYGDGVLQIAQMTIVNQKMQSSPDAATATQEVGTRLSEADVEVSPRYGTFDPRGQIVQEPLPWIEASTPPPAQPVQ